MKKIIIILGLISVFILSLASTGTIEDITGKVTACRQGWVCVDETYRAFQYEDCTYFPEHTTFDKARLWQACNEGKICKNTFSSIKCVEPALHINKS